VIRLGLQTQRKKERKILTMERRWNLRTAEAAAEGADNRAMTTGLAFPIAYLSARVRARTAERCLGTRSRGSSQINMCACVCVAHRRILGKAECSASTARCSALLLMGLGITSLRLDAEHRARAISCQIEPQEMMTHGLCKVRLRT